MLDFDKPVRFKGSKVEVFITPSRAPGYVHIEWQLGDKWMNAYRERNALGLADLENIPETVTLDGWCNVYAKDEWVDIGAPYRTREAALKGAGGNAIACIHIHREITVGAVGFGCAMVTCDGEHIYDECSAERLLTLRDIEKRAALEPTRDWRVTMYGPLHGEVYQRHDDTGQWTCIESNEGFA